MKGLKIFGIIITIIIVVGATAAIIFYLTGIEKAGWICTEGKWVKQGDTDIPPPLEPCLSEDETKKAALANPASVNCEKQGGKVEMRKDVIGGEYGVCIFGNGKECEEWALFRGECASTTEFGLIERRGDSTTLKMPFQNDLVVSPLAVEGSMPGNWYFESVAQVEILDATGKVLGRAPVQAQTEWMTTTPVNFKSTVEFAYPSTATGTLVLRNDNPSGLPENSRSESYPINFGTKIKVFFGNTEKDPEVMDCTRMFAVERVVPKTPDIARAALEELLGGPSDAEKTAKYFSSINDGVIIQKLIIENGIAKVDFSKRLEEAVGGSCRVAAISSQIQNTLKQFPTVKNVIISIDGRTEDILQP